MNILLAVTGSISSYKAYDILRGFVKKEHHVKVIMTAGAMKFIKADTFLYLGAQEVYTADDDFNTQKLEGTVLHIELAKWTDKLVIAPLSANTLAKLANGQADDLLSSVFLSLGEKQSILFPAMNTQMYVNPITQQNKKNIELNKNTFIHPPASGELACGDIGVGKLPEVETIVEFSLTYSGLKNDRKILITTGATVAPLDPVRYLTNPSSGKTGLELAKTYLSEGCNVVLVYGKNSQIDLHTLKEHPLLKAISVDTTENMYQVVKDHFDSADVFISSAAVSDIEFNQEDKKLKKDKTGTSLNFKWAKDVLAQMLKNKKNQKVISFAAESSEDHSIFQNKWDKKPVDLMVGNVVHNGFNGQPQGFGQNKNQYFFIKDGKVDQKQEMTKEELSKFIMNFTEK